MTRTLAFKGLLQNKEWISPAFVSIDENGKILSIEKSSNAENIEQIDGLAIPAVPNAHSHAFQYAMAGMGEVHPADSQPDDFWSWREAMYNLALTINPDQMEAIATQLYSEMVKHGYNSVAEFHYLHHDQNGKPYNNMAEMGERLVTAAKNTGIKITLIPIFYQKGGFGMEPTEKQRRFISPTFEDYMKLYESSEKACRNYEHANVTPGIHSMRGVTTEDITKLANWKSKDQAFHIHVSEQLKEIEDSLAYLGKRPVEWLLDNLEMDQSYQLVHATHLTDDETKKLAESKAQVVICPTTEGNLGDGLFPLKTFQEYGGNWCIGTDSHISISPMEELRLLDYGQRLISHKRNTYFSTEEGNSGLYSMDQAIHRGRKAVNDFQSDYFTIGEDFDALIMDANHPLIATSKEEFWMSTILYSLDNTSIKGTMIAGQWKSKDLNHINKEEIHTNFINALNDLKNRA